MLEAVELERHYQKRAVIRPLSLQVLPGEIVGLLGPNGAGKTTLFEMLVGLTTPSRGDVFLNQKRITPLPLYRRARLGLGYLPQEPSVFRRMTVEENVLAILELTARKPISVVEKRQRVESLLEELGLLPLAKQPASTLSGGERRRLEITRAMVHAPFFLLLDEPFSGIDPIMVIEIQQILLQLKEQGLGILMTDHNIRETLSICDRAYILHGGEILFSGTPLEIAENSQARALYLGNRFDLSRRVAPDRSG